MNFLNNTYIGKITSCHIQTLFNGYFKDNNYNTYILLEILSTNPFGVQFIPNDVNRILDSYLDFDLGLDRIFELLNIDFRITYNNSVTKSLIILKEWLKDGSVIVGPLNMENLNYFFYHNLYKNLDHYLIIHKYKNKKIYILDSEGIYISLKEQNFVQSWQGDKIIEGRGKYIMRQILNIPKINFSNIDYNKLYLYIIDNISKAQKNSAYQKLATIDINQYLYIKNNLNYAISNRLQKLYIQKEFFTNKNPKIILLLNKQINIYNEMLFQILERKNPNLKEFLKIDELENSILEEIKRLIK